MFGDAKIKCQHDGTWTKPPDCLKQCDVPVIANSNITNANITTFTNDSSVDIICNGNAKIQGNNSTTCYNGTWLDTPDCEIYKCFDPSVGTHASIDNKADYLVDTSYLVTCDKGYTGIITAYCNNSGIWNITGSCLIRNCPSVSTIPYSINNYNSTVKYSWNDTFTYRYIIFIVLGGKSRILQIKRRASAVP